jgi:hypothetical protein
VNSRVAFVFIAALCGFAVASANASECSTQVAQLQQSVAGSPGIVGTAPQSLGAQLDHQPTPASVANAKQNARSDVIAVLERAKDFDAEGKASECWDALGKAKLLLNP